MIVWRAPVRVKKMLNVNRLTSVKPMLVKSGRRELAAVDGGVRSFDLAAMSAAAGEGCVSGITRAAQSVQPAASAPTTTNGARSPSSSAVRPPTAGPMLTPNSRLP